MNGSLRNGTAAGDGGRAGAQAAGGAGTGARGPGAFRAAAGPAWIALGITALRFALEAGDAPAWLASRAMGGGAALLGVVWTPLFVGPWLAYRLAAYAAPGGAFWKRLLRAACAYGLLSRAPIVLITIPAVLGEWGMHYDRFPGLTGVPERIAAGFVAQLGFWACVWTPLVGLLAARIAFLVRPPTFAPQTVGAAA